MILWDVVLIVVPIVPLAILGAAIYVSYLTKKSDKHETLSPLAILKFWIKEDFRRM
ncbi:hypothetical protein BN983_00766 [Halobacillus karajensis]|uniref:Uncharacterized protein n=1 Tax=Halobacillus karajensis TaxID=195088 RepID=A0A059NW81_9BACI|nr:hypothetical protein BN983_00766 [Halobacillus karajensis]CDQ26035.1 hypothetical protein BN981_00246 [Halobacillus karajensis]